MSNSEIRRLEVELEQSKAILSERWRTLELEVTTLANSAKEGASQTIQEAKQAISIRHQVAKRPWTMLAGSVVTGIALSRVFGVRSLTVLGIAAPLLKNAMSTTPTPESISGQSPMNHLSDKSESMDKTQDGFIKDLRFKAITSLADIARELVRKNIPQTLVPIIEQAISHSTQSMLTPSSSVAKSLNSEKRVINDKGESISLH